MKNKYLKKDYFYIIIAIFIFALFTYISYKTPLAGDDWGYFINGSKGNPISMAFSFYFTWSGRFFSEMWGFFMTHHKFFWNLINGALFSLIFVGIYKLSNIDSKKVLVPLVILACVLSVDDHLRMETYSWIMGTTYVIPLCMSIWYFVIAEKIICKNIKNKVALSVISNTLLFVIGLMMENIAATMLFATIVLVIYSYFNKRNVVNFFLLNSGVSLCSFIIMRLSPGSNFRMLRDSAEWASLNLFEKIIGAYPSFIENTFINNNYLILILSIAIILLLLFTKRKINRFYKMLSIIICFIGCYEVFSFAFPFALEVHSGNSLFSMIFWPIYTIIVMTAIIVCIYDDMRKNKTVLFFMVAGTSSMVMLLSPIYGSRSSIYTVFYIILVIVLIIEELPLSKITKISLVAFMLFIIADRTIEYLNKYKLVGEAYSERLQIIDYYKEHPEEEAWIPRFPIYTVHGSDIEPGDVYHFEVFKEYFGLPQDTDKIYFYYKQ